MANMGQPGGMPMAQKAGLPSGGSGGMKAQRSIFNPQDLGRDVSEGRLDMNRTTIRQFFQQRGLDVDGPVSQLIPWAQKQAQNATPLGKMQGATQAAPAPAMGRTGAMPGAKPMVQQPSGGGLADLMKQVGK